MSDDAPKNLLSADVIKATEEYGIEHPLNPGSAVYFRLIGRATGLQRAQVNLARIPPGKQAFAYHAHELEEEWIYILSGRGRTEIDGRTYEVGPGDFMGFPAPSVAHVLENPYEEDLVYLVGSEVCKGDVVRFPKQKKFLIRADEKMYFADEEQMQAASFSDYTIKKP